METENILFRKEYNVYREFYFLAYTVKCSNRLYIYEKDMRLRAVLLQLVSLMICVLKKTFSELIDFGYSVPSVACGEHHHLGCYRFQIAGNAVRCVCVRAIS